MIVAEAKFVIVLLMWTGQLKGGLGLESDLRGIWLRKNSAAEARACFGSRQVKSVAVNMENHVAGIETNNCIGASSRRVEKLCGGGHGGMSLAWADLSHDLRYELVLIQL